MASRLVRLPGLLLALVSLLFCTHGLAAEAKYEFSENNNLNQIPYFDNRFRIDAQLDEIKLLFYRVHGSVPIILVRPDGSKININNYPKDSVEWHDDSTFDLVRIIKPMPGPWQALGDILPESKIMVITDVQLSVEPLPDILLAGETLKVSAKVFNGDVVIDAPEFRHVVHLDVDFFSTNNAAHDNFGAVPVKLTSFRDDGRILDEYAGDNIFTGEFNLNFASGEWLPIYLVKMPMASREVRLKPVMLYNVPVTLSAETTLEEGGFHKIHFVIDNSHVKPDSFIFQGKITYPDRQVESFSIAQGKGVERIKELAFIESGFHRINVSAFGETKNGREFRLVIPEFTFNVEAEQADMSEGDPATETALSYEEKAQRSAELVAQKLEEERVLREALAKEKQQQSINLIILMILIILVLAFATYFGLRWRNARAKAKGEQ